MREEGDRSSAGLWSPYMPADTDPFGRLLIQHVLCLPRSILRAFVEGCNRVRFSAGRVVFEGITVELDIC